MARRPGPGPSAVSPSWLEKGDIRAAGKPGHLTLRATAGCPFAHNRVRECFTQTHVITR
jgi:hypothetical protein